MTDLREKSIFYLDSMGHKRPDVLARIFQYLQDESTARRNVALKPLEWKQHSMAAEEIPQQGNGSDCGVFTCQYADYISRGQPLPFLSSTCLCLGRRWCGKSCTSAYWGSTHPAAEAPLKLFVDGPKDLREAGWAEDPGNRFWAIKRGGMSPILLCRAKLGGGRAASEAIYETDGTSTH